MLAAFLCLVFSISCDIDSDIPVYHKAKIEHLQPVIKSATVSKVGVKHVGVKPASLFSATCDVQPPIELSNHFAAASRKYYLGATDCELARQAKAESNFKIDAVSPVGAIGVSQFMPRTAEELRIDPWNPRESIFAQAKYVLWCRDGWDPSIGGRTVDDVAALGLGSYNFGRSAMYRNQRNHGWVLYKDAKPNLPKETHDYVYKIMGL